MHKDKDKAWESETEPSALGCFAFTNLGRFAAISVTATMLTSE